MAIRIGTSERSELMEGKAETSQPMERWSGQQPVGCRSCSGVLHPGPAIASEGSPTSPGFLSGWVEA